MDITAVKTELPTSPAFVFDHPRLTTNLEQLYQLKQASGCQVLYSIKSLPLTQLLALIKPYVDGFSVSSLFEAQLAREIIADHGSVHLATPGIRPDELTALSDVCSHISLNSLSQYQRFQHLLGPGVSLGLRVNPKLSYIDDDRYNPCRLHSKLGIAFEELAQHIDLSQIQGLHLHIFHATTDYAGLTQTITKLTDYFGRDLEKLAWLNIGGGFLHHDIDNDQPFIDCVSALISRYHLDVYIEPGKAVVGNTGFLITTVIDSFVSDGKTIAVLDTSVNHLPEVFEYQSQPHLHEHDPNGRYNALLVGSTCLAGDIFGDYRFNQPLAVGDRLVFTSVGAYSLVKAHRFNGFNLPDVYLYSDNKLNLCQRYSYQNYRALW